MQSCHNLSSIVSEVRITIDSVMRMDKKHHPQVYLEQCKYRIKKIQIPLLINAELDSDSDSRYDTELLTKLKSSADSE